MLADRLGLSGRTLVVGLGRTGLSCARFLNRLGLEVAVTDDREAPPGLEEVRRDLPDVALYTGGFSAAALDRCDQLVVSPGVPLDDPFVLRGRERGLEIIGDIELFARCAGAPVLAVTGSNGKSTVTALLGEMARAAGRQVKVGGNIGVPALDLLEGDAPDLYVLELSSFQLEATMSLDARAAVILNAAPDHLDRYAGMAEYVAAKLRIFQGGGVAVLNRDDPLLWPARPAGERVVSFGAGEPPDRMSFGIVQDGGRRWLARGGERLVAADEIRLRGGHNLLNALAALAMGSAAGLDQAGMFDALRSFGGLAHRMQAVAVHGGVTWINDSKGTNVAATLAAVAGLDGRVVLIAGGLGKGQDFSPLRPALAARARAVVLIGRDAPDIARALEGAVLLERAADMTDAVRRAAALARPGDTVLLSPACASFDMFSGYEDRGSRFMSAVGELTR